MKHLIVMTLLLSQFAGIIFANEQDLYPYTSKFDQALKVSANENHLLDHVYADAQPVYIIPGSIKYLILLLTFIGTLSLVYAYIRIGEVAKQQSINNGEINYLKRIARNCIITEKSIIYEQNQNQKRTNSKLPQIVFTQGVLEEMVEGINHFSKLHMEVETGYALVGKIIGSNEKRKIHVNGLVEAGPGTQRSSGHVKFNRQYQQTEIDKMRLIDWNLCHVGDSHLHPGSMDRCSSGDYKTDRENVINSKTQEMVFVIATKCLNYRKCPEDSIIMKGLKLNFFYMGKGSNYEYQQFTPEIISEQSIKVNDSLSNYYDTDPTKVTLDFDNLNRLSNYSYQLLDYPIDKGVTSPCIEMTHKNRFKILIFFGDSTSEKPTVYIEVNNEMFEYKTDYLNNSQGDHIWFTQIALSVEKEMQKRAKSRNIEEKTMLLDV